MVERLGEMRKGRKERIKKRTRERIEKRERNKKFEEKYGPREPLPFFRIF